MPYYVYILASRKNGTLYTGITDNPARRIHEHKSGAVSGFTRKYGVKMLVYVESHDDVEQAILREKRVKRWRRAWKIQLIQQGNPEWRDLYEDVMK